MTEKLQKTLADHGFGSRREMEKWIAAGRVTVNGKVAGVGLRVEAADRIVVDGRALVAAPRVETRILLLNKRAGVIVSRRDPKRRASVFDDLPPLPGGRWISVGRLDLQTTGLLLLTNRGDLAHKLTHPSTGIDREYAVRVSGRLDDDALRLLKTGPTKRPGPGGVDPVGRAGGNPSRRPGGDAGGRPGGDAGGRPGGDAGGRPGGDAGGRKEGFSDIRYYDGKGANHWYHVVLLEGRNREVRRLFEAADVSVTRLKRVRYGPVVLPPWLPRGARFELGPRDVATLTALVGLASPKRRRQPAPRQGRSVLIPYPRLAGGAA